MQVNMNGSEANLAFPGMLNEQYAAFAATLEDADTPPPSSSRRCTVPCTRSCRLNWRCGAS